MTTEGSRKDLADVLDGYHLLHATRAELLRLTGNPAERALLEQRLA